MAFYLFLSAPSSPGEDSLEARTQDFKKVVLPIADVKLSDVRLKDILGTGFCLDPECRFVGTTYHLARIAQPKKIKGQKVIRLDLATGPDDEGATDNYSPSLGHMKYTGPCRFRTTLSASQSSWGSFPSRRLAAWPAGGYLRVSARGPSSPSQPSPVSRHIPGPDGRRPPRLRLGFVRQGSHSSRRQRRNRRRQ